MTTIDRPGAVPRIPRPKALPDAAALTDPRIIDGLTRLAVKMRRALPFLKAHEVEDLVQTCVALAIERLPEFRGRSSLKTWVTSLARNKIIDMSRRAAIRPTPAGERVDARSVPSADSREASHLSEQVVELVSWLRSDPADAVAHGADVLILLIRSGASWGWVAGAMTAYTDRPWTVDGVKSVVERIKSTERGRRLIASLKSGVKEGAA